MDNTEPSGEVPSTDNSVGSDEVRQAAGQYRAETSTSINHLKVGRLTGTEGNAYRKGRAGRTASDTKRGVG